MGVTENPENRDKRDFIAARLRGLADEVLKLKSPRHVIFMENKVNSEHPGVEDMISSWVIFLSSGGAIAGIEDHTKLDISGAEPPDDLECA